MTEPRRRSAARDVLSRVFGYADFRGDQEAIIEHVVAGGDALVLMPTGGGKSLCYQIPALLRAGTAIVVSPLIALMQDQVDALTQLGVRAACLNSSLDIAAQSAIERAWGEGELDLLYVAPERLLTPRFLDLLDARSAALFAIDEAHCVSEWGHDFRPEYRALDLLHQRWPDIPRLALTATADARTREEIAERLALENARRFVGSFDRPNICYRVAYRRDGRRQLADFLAGHTGESGIVYASSRARVDATAAWLVERGIDALPYHAGLDAEVRAANQRRFLREDGVVMVATIAFGMGIDKPDVRFVAHLDLPRSIEGYYQETGRAGRDGAPAEAWMTFGLADVVLVSQRIAESSASDERKRVERSKMESLLAYAETTVCRRRTLLAAFGEDYGAPACGNCDNCLEPPRLVDATEPARMLLSCVYRSGQRFGAGHVIDILRGVDNERMQRLGHHRLSTFGIGVQTDARQWRGLCRQLLARGFLVADAEGYGTLRLTAAAAPVLKGTQKVEVRAEESVGRSSLRRSSEAVAGDDVVAADAPLWQALRELRSRLAREQGVPAYVIFHDATLRAMLAARPRTREELAGVSGVGVTKLERYGEAFLRLLAAT